MVHEMQATGIASVHNHCICMIHPGKGIDKFINIKEK